MDDASLSWRWLAPIEASGDWQMAIDRWLLQRAVAGDRQPVLRCYRWSRPTLSLGHHQPLSDPGWQQALERGQIDLVRRPSGGGGVLHAGDLTYALVWPQAPSRRRQAYSQACAWLIEGFAQLGVSLGFGTAPATGPERHCFSSSTAADLIEASGSKRVGSAQHWHRGCLLQHGSILLTPPDQLWRQLFATPAPELTPLPAAARHWRDLASHLASVAAERLPQRAGGTPLETMRLSAADWQQIDQLRLAA